VFEETRSFDVHVIIINKKKDFPVTMNVKVSKEDILSLYIPFWLPGQNNAHTRSVLICKQKKTPILDEKQAPAPLKEQETVFYSGKEQRQDNAEPPSSIIEDTDENIIIDGITFSLVISFNRAVSLNALLRFLIMRYCGRAYGSKTTQNCESVIHTRLETDDPSHKVIGKKIKAKLSDVDTKNFNDFTACKKQNWLEDDTENDIEWQWRPAGDCQIENELYREMRNINFIRGVYNIDIRNGNSMFANDRQCRLVFDNHKILYSVLNLLRFPVEIEGHILTIKVLHNPQKDSTRYELYDLTSPGASQHYVENQIRLLVASERTMQFDEVLPYRGGLLLPSSCDFTDASVFNFPNTLEMMYDHKIRDDSNMRKKDAPLPVCYNRFYIDLENELQLKHVYYGTRKTILFKDIVLKNLAKKPGAKKSGDENSTNGSKPTKKITTLNRFFTNASVTPKTTVFTSNEKKRASDHDNGKDIETKKFKFG
jgi:hypothetical protein